MFIQLSFCYQWYVRAICDVSFSFSLYLPISRGPFIFMWIRRVSGLVSDLENTGKSVYLSRAIYNGEW